MVNNVNVAPCARQSREFLGEEYIFVLIFLRKNECNCQNRYIRVCNIFPTVSPREGEKTQTLSDFTYHYSAFNSGAINVLDIVSICAPPKVRACHDIRILQPITNIVLEKMQK